MDSISAPSSGQYVERRSSRLQWLLLLVGVILAPALSAHVGSDYITLEQHTNTHPEQASLMRSFNAQVKAPAKPISTPQHKTIKIAAVYPGLQQSDYWRRNIQAFSLRLEKLNLDYQFDDHPLPVTTSLEQRQQAIDSALSKDPDYLILTLDDAGQQRLIEKLLARQRPKIILLNITTPLKAWASQQPLIYVGFDHIKGSQMLAEHLFQQTPNKPTNIGVLYRQPGYVSRMRGGAFIDAMQQHGVRLNSAYYTQADSPSAYRATLAMLQSDNRPDFIYASSTDLALGAIQAIAEQGLTGIIGVNGWGGGSAELDAIQKQLLAITVMRMNDDTGIAIAEAIRNDLSRQPVPQIYSGRFAIVTPQLSSEQIQQLSSEAFRYSGP